MTRTYTYGEMQLGALPTDLRNEALEAAHEAGYTMSMDEMVGSWDYIADVAVAYEITIYDETGTRQEPAGAVALYIAPAGRLGIAQGADASWADVADVESGIEMWLNDGDSWMDRN